MPWVAGDGWPRRAAPVPPPTGSQAGGGPGRAPLLTSQSLPSLILQGSEAGRGGREGALGAEFVLPRVLHK